MYLFEYLIFFLLQISRHLWITEERRSQEELSSLGDLSDKWHSQQMTLLNQHVTLINMYGVALDTLDAFAHSGKNFVYFYKKNDYDPHLEAYELKLVNSMINIIGVNSLRVGSFQFFFK